MAASAGLAFGHVSHTGFTGALAIVVLLGVTVAALVSLYVEVVAKYRIVNRF